MRHLIHRLFLLQLATPLLPHRQNQLSKQPLHRTQVRPQLSELSLMSWLSQQLELNQHLVQFV